MLDRLREHLAQTGLIPRGERVLVGFSGGADSTCLVHLVHRLGLDIVAAHLHHSQREEADEEQEQCRIFAESLQVPFISGRSDVPLMKAELGIGLEEAGRKARYAFFKQAARHHDCGLVATAHTRTDHVETILHHLIRGCGLTGLAGIPEKRQEIIRPLLPFDRAETRAYCATNALPFHEDPSNDDLSFARARIRHRILPELEAINPNVNESVARMAAIVGSEDRFLNGMAAASLERAERAPNLLLSFLTADIEITLDHAIMASLPEVLFRRAMRLAVEALGGQLDSNQTVSLVEGFRDRERGAITADGGTVAVEWSPDKIVVRNLHEPADFRYNLEIPGEVESPEMGWRLIAYKRKPNDEPSLRASMEVEVDARAVEGNLYFRRLRRSDDIQPLGFSHRRKLSDVLSEAHVSQAARSRLPIVCDFVGPVWVPGVCLDERIRKQKSSITVTVLRFEPLIPLQRHNEETHPLAQA